MNSDFPLRFWEARIQLQVGFLVELMWLHFDSGLIFNILKNLDFIGSDKSDGFSFQTSSRSSSNAMDIISNSSRQMIIDHKIYISDIQASRSEISCYKNIGSRRLKRSKIGYSLAILHEWMQLGSLYLQLLEGLADECAFLAALYKDDHFMPGVTLKNIH